MASATSKAASAAATAATAASKAASAAAAAVSSPTTKSFIQTLKSYIKKPWEYTGPCASPEYKLAIPAATEYRIECPASTKIKPIVPTSNPEHVFDIKYYSRDQRRNRPPIRRTILKKADIEKMRSEIKFDDVKAFPPVYLTTTVVEDLDTHGGGYQK